MADSRERFEKKYTQKDSQGIVSVTEIWVDKETGVNDLWHYSGQAGGLSPLLDGEGKVVVSPPGKL